MFKKTCSFLLPVLLLAGCNKAPSIEPEPELIPINISTEIATKVTDSGYDAGDAVGVYIVNENNGQSQSLQNTGNHADNFRYTLEAGKWKPEKEIYWKDQTTRADFYCYYPYANVVDDIHQWNISAAADQSTLENFKRSDFTWGKVLAQTPSEKPVKLMTNHLMSSFVIYLKPGKGYTEESFAATRKQVKILNLKTAAKVDLVNGSVTAVGTGSDILPFEQRNYWRALVVPQDVLGARLVEIQIDNNVYYLTQTISFKPNTMHKCTLTINRIGEGVNIGIGEWETDEKDYGGTLE